MSKTITTNWDPAAGRILPELNIFIPDGAELDDEDLPTQPWPGVDPVCVPGGGYRYSTTERANDALVVAYAIVSYHHLDSWNVWDFQGHGGCSYHWSSDHLSTCNGANGSVAPRDFHPNFAMDLTDGTRIEACWDELACHTSWTSTNIEITDALAASIIMRALELVGTTPTDWIMAAATLQDAAWVATVLDPQLSFPVS